MPNSPACDALNFVAAASNLVQAGGLSTFHPFRTFRECLLTTDAVEKVGCWQKRTVALRLDERERPLSSCDGPRDRVEFGELSEVLGCCCKVELVAGAVRTA